MATIAELIGVDLADREVAAEGFRCPRCGGVVPTSCEWQPLPAPPGRLRAFMLRHERPDGAPCHIFAGGPLPEGENDR